MATDGPSSHGEGGGGSSPGRVGWTAVRACGSTAGRGAAGGGGGGLDGGGRRGGQPRVRGRRRLRRTCCGGGGGGVGRRHVRVDALQGRAEELARAQVGGLEEIRLLPDAHRLQHSPLSIVVRPLEEERGKPSAAGRGRGHLPPPWPTPRSTAPFKAPSRRSRRSMDPASPSLSFCATCSRATESAAWARCSGSCPRPSAAARVNRGQSASNSLNSSS